MEKLIDTTPCGKIKKGTSSVQYMNAFNNINKASVLNEPNENGFFLVNDQYLYGQAIGGEALTISDGAKNYTHTHPNRPEIDEYGNNYHGNVKNSLPRGYLSVDCKLSKEK